jgi:hypothetical protein
MQAAHRNDIFRLLGTYSTLIGTEKIQAERERLQHRDDSRFVFIILALPVEDEICLSPEGQRALLLEHPTNRQEWKRIEHSPAHTSRYTPGSTTLTFSRHKVLLVSRLHTGCWVCYCYKFSP